MTAVMTRRKHAKRYLTCFIGGILLKKYFLVSATFIVSLAILGWNMLSPTVSEQDVQINAILKPIPRTHYMNERFSGSHFDYKLKIVLDNKTDKPLSTAFSYFFTVYPYIDGNINVAWEYFDPKTGDILKIAEGFSSGTDGRTEVKSSKKLKEMGITLLKDNKWFWVDGIYYSPRGFSYGKDKFPVGVIFYIVNNNIINKDRNYVLYTHYEIKMGKDVSWTKVYPVEFNED